MGAGRGSPPGWHGCRICMVGAVLIDWSWLGSAYRSMRTGLIWFDLGLAHLASSYCNNGNQPTRGDVGRDDAGTCARVSARLCRFQSIDRPAPLASQPGDRCDRRRSCLNESLDRLDASHRKLHHHTSRTHGRLRTHVHFPSFDTHTHRASPRGATAVLNKQGQPVRQPQPMRRALLKSAPLRPQPQQQLLLLRGAQRQQLSTRRRALGA